MSRSDDQRIADIRQVLDELDEIVGLGRERYDADPVVRRAVERLLEITGEAAKHVSDSGRARFPDADWRRPGRMRDVLSHRYFRVDYDLIWGIATTDAPKLREALRGPEDET